MIARRRTHSSKVSALFLSKSACRNRKEATVEGETEFSGGVGNKLSVDVESSKARQRWCRGPGGPRHGSEAIGATVNSICKFSCNKLQQGEKLLWGARRKNEV